MNDLRERLSGRSYADAPRGFLSHYYTKSEALLVKLMRWETKAPKEFPQKEEPMQEFIEDNVNEIKALVADQTFEDLLISCGGMALKKVRKVPKEPPFPVRAPPEPEKPEADATDAGAAAKDA